MRLNAQILHRETCGEVNNKQMRGKGNEVAVSPEKHKGVENPAGNCGPR